MSEAILIRVARGELGATARLHRPARELAFSKQDRAATGFPAAVAAARAAGFPSVVRLAGGRAAVFHEHTLAFAWSSPDPRPVAHTRERFEVAADVIAGGMRRMGVDARIGQVPGEYCPGAFSINARGRVKLAGIGQRMIAGAAHVGAVIVVDGSELLRSVIEPVYAALGLEWDPATAGSIADEVPGAGLDAVEEALVAELGERFELERSELDPQTLALAAELESAHLA